MQHVHSSKHSTFLGKTEVSAYKEILWLHYAYKDFLRIQCSGLPRTPLQSCDSVKDDEIETLPMNQSTNETSLKTLWSCQREKFTTNVTNLITTMQYVFTQIVLKDTKLFLL